MKVRTGGGGVDKDGNAYTYPEEEIEVPDDFFRKLWQSSIDSSRLEYELERERPSPEQPDPEAT
jgi:hypothetical protein